MEYSDEEIDLCLWILLRRDSDSKTYVFHDMCQAQCSTHITRFSNLLSIPLGPTALMACSTHKGPIN